MIIGKIGAPAPSELVANIYKQQTTPPKRIPYQVRYSPTDVTISEIAKKLNAELTQAAEKAALEQSE